MNIAYVHAVSKIGGAERVTLDIMRSATCASDALYMVTPEQGPLSDAARACGATAIALKCNQPDLKHPVKTLRNHVEWLRFLRGKRIELIHTGDLFITRTIVPAANLLDIPVICHVHFPMDYPAIRWIFSTQPRNVQFIYCSQELYQSTGTKIANVVPNSRHHVIHNGVDTELYARFTPTTSLLPKGAINIGVIANLQERKGHLDFIDAANILCRNRDNLHFHIIGGDIFGETREPLLRARVDTLGLQRYFTFHGQVKNVREFLNELDIFVCSSHEEAFPISILEAMSFALPIVSTNVNGIPEALTDSETGLLVPARNPKLLAEAIEKLVQSPNLRSNLSHRAREDVESKFSIDVFARKVAAVYQATLSAPRA